MRRTGKSLLALCMAALSLTLTMAGRAQAPPDPEAALKEINTWFSDQLKQARDNKVQADTTKLLAERVTRAKAAVKDVDVAKTDPAKCLALAQLYQITQQPREMLNAAQRYLTSNPEAGPKYTAQQLMLSGYQRTEDADGIAATLEQMKPPSPQMAALLAGAAARSYAPIIADKKGLQAGLDLLKKMEEQIPFDSLKTEQEKNVGASALAALAIERSELYEKAGKKAEALAALEAGAKRLDPKSPYLRSLNSKLALAKLPGLPAPELKVDRHYGDFTSLAALKGKVVVLDFTAHW